VKLGGGQGRKENNKASTALKYKTSVKLED
jgi:hypothetical protein